MTLELKTERLTLRPIAPEDVDAHCAMMATPEAARFLTLDKRPQSRSAAWRAFASYLGHWRRRGFGFFSVFETATGEWVGRVGPWRPEGWPGLECGWGIRRESWGRGYAPEASVAAIRWIFETFPDLPRIISLIDPQNGNSQAVARKVGEEKTDETFTFEGALVLDVWACPREAWLREFGR